MKTAIKTIVLVAIIMLGTCLGYAKGTTNPANAVDGKKVKVEFKSVKMGQALTIKDDSGITIYNRLVENDGDFSKSFDFSSLPNGIYSAELDKGFEILVKSFSINNGTVNFLADEKLFKPVIRKKDNRLYVSKNNINKETLNIVIYYNNKAIVKEKIKTTLNRVYKLPENKKGNYKVVIKSNEREYLEII